MRRQPIQARSIWLRGRCTNEKSRLPDSGRKFEASVEGHKRVRFEPATLLWASKNDGVEIIVSDQDTRTIPGYFEFADSERLIGDEAERPDSQEFRIHFVEKKRSSMSPERRD